MVLTEATGITIKEIFPNPEIQMAWFTQSSIDTNEAVTITTMDEIKWALTLRNNSGALDYLEHTLEVSGEDNHIKLTDASETGVAITGLVVGYNNSAVKATNTATTTTEAGGTTVIKSLTSGPGEGILVVGDADMTTNEAVTIEPISNGTVEGAYILKNAAGTLTSDSCKIDDTNELDKIQNDATNASAVDSRFIAWGLVNRSHDNSGSALTEADNVHNYKLAPGPAECKMYYFEATMSTDESVTLPGLDVVDGVIAYKYASGVSTVQTIDISVSSELNKVKNTTTNSDVEVRGIVWGRNNSAGTLLAVGS